MHKVQRVITLLGNTSVGKSTIIIRLIENRFEKEYDPTINKVFQYKLSINNIEYDLLINDTAGLEKYAVINGNYLRSDGFILLYSIADRQSFEIVQSIFETLEDELINNVPMILVGNKSDLSEDRVISYTEGEQLARQKKALFFETSAFNSKNVKETFITLLNLIDQPNNNNNNINNNNNNNINSNHLNSITNNQLNDKTINHINNNNKLDSVNSNLNSNKTQHQTNPNKSICTIS